MAAAIAPAAAVLAAAAPKLIYRLILGRHATAVAGEGITKVDVSILFDNHLLIGNIKLETSTLVDHKPNPFISNTINIQFNKIYT